MNVSSFGTGLATAFLRDIVGSECSAYGGTSTFFFTGKGTGSDSSRWRLEKFVCLRLTTRGSFAAGGLIIFFLEVVGAALAFSGDGGSQGFRREILSLCWIGDTGFFRI